MRVEPITIGKSYTNTRRWRRFKINVPIRAIVQRQGRVLIVDGRGNDLSEGGLRVYAGVELRVGDNVDIEFTPPYHGLPIRTRCVVRHRNGYYYGVEFLRENTDDKEKVESIRQMLKALGSPIQ